MFPGLSQRLQRELESLAPAGQNIRVGASPERKYSVWAGGSVFASLSTFQSMCITKEDYDDEGPGVVNRKCA